MLSIFVRTVIIYILLGVSIYLAITARTGKKISRLAGATSRVIYAGYLIFVVEI